MMRHSFEKMPFRLRAFGTHLLASVCLLTLILVVLYAGWYRWPGWYLVGAEAIVGLLILVDVGVGPLATLVVSNPAKPRLEWRRDVILVVVVQLLALGYGVYTLWLGRPLFYTFSSDRIVVVRANAFRDETVEAARREGARILPDWTSFPRWISTEQPSSSEERSRLAISVVLDGEDLHMMPKYFRPWADNLAALQERLIPIDRLADIKSLEADFQSRIAELNQPDANLGVLPVRGTRRDGAWILDRNSGAPLAFLPVDIWALKK